MPNQELLSYISKQLEADVTETEIRQSLMQSGWDSAAVEKAFNSISAVTQPQEKKATSKTVYILFEIIIVLLIILGLVYAISQNIFKNTSSTSVLIEPATNIRALPVNGNLTDYTNTDNPSLELNFEDSFTSSVEISKNLVECIPSIVEFTHPFDKQTYTHEIKGFVDDKCYYIQTMPKEGKQECYFTTEQSEQMYEYARSVMEAINVSSKSTITADGSETINTEVNDEVTIENPLINALKDGSCVISGY